MLFLSVAKLKAAMYCLPAVLLVAFIGRTLSGAPQLHNLTIYGAGISTCARWSMEREQILSTGIPSAFAWEQMGWIHGYMTAVAEERAGEAAAHLPNATIVAAALDSYCFKRPDDFLAAATSVIVRNNATVDVQSLPQGQ